MLDLVHGKGIGKSQYQPESLPSYCTTHYTKKVPMVPFLYSAPLVLCMIFEYIIIVRYNYLNFEINEINNKFEEFYEGGRYICSCKY